MNSDNNLTFTEFLNDWLRTSKTHGLDRIVISKSTLLKVVWIISLTLSIGVCSFLITRIVLDYLRYEVKSRIREVYVPEVSFPKVSACNYNPLVTKEANDFIADYFEQNLNVTISKFTDYFANSNSELIAELGYLFYTTLDPSFNQTLRKSFGYHPLILCKYYDYDCKHDLELIYDTAYGNCFLINSNRYANGSERETFKAFFQDFGLNIMMFLGVQESETSYLFETSGQKGIMLRVEDVDYDGVMLNGVGVMPGTQAQISLTRIETHRMPYPYSNCLPIDQIDTKASVYMKQNGLKYNRRSCMYMCQQIGIVEKTGCNNMQISAKVPGYPMCQTKEQFNKMSNIAFDLARCIDLCPIECDAITYEMSVSYANFPSYDAFYLIMGMASDAFSSVFGTKNITYDMFRKTVAGASIIYKEIKYTEIIETPAMTFVDLIAAIGGMMGLFLGFSIMIFVEFVELVLHFFIFGKNKVVRNINNKINSSI